MDYAGSLGVNTRELFKMIEQGIYQGVLIIPRGRMNHQARRFIDNTEVLILVYHLQGDIFRLRKIRFFLLWQYDNLIAWLNPVMRPDKVCIFYPDTP